MNMTWIDWSFGCGSCLGDGLFQAVDQQCIRLSGSQPVCWPVFADAGGRNGVITLAMLIVPIFAFVFFSHSDFAVATAEVTHSLEGVSEEWLISQLAAPAMLIYLLPPGLLGLFTVALIFAAVSTDDTPLHSWGSIFVQDVLMPLRKKPFTPAMHMNVLRWAVIGVAVFAFFWSMYFPLRDYVLMYMLAMGTIYLGGSGAVIIGGLYWRRATTADAWCAMIV